MESLNELWNLIVANCELTDTAYNVFFKNIVPMSMNDSEIVLQFPNKFTKECIEKQFEKRIKTAILNTLGFELNIKYMIQDEAPAVQKEVSEPIVNAEQYTFENFIVGPSNKFAYAAAVAVAKSPGSSSGSKSYNPLFLYGNSGLGKTHLLNAICYVVRQNNPQMNILYTRGEDFANEFISSLSNKTVDEFKEKYRNVDLLLVDDIQFIAGKIQIQEEFFHTFDSLVSSGKQVVLTSDRPPKEIQTLEERLRSRFEWGLLADLQSPDNETRIAILRKKADDLKFDIPDDVIEYIAEKIKSNVRQLEGTINKLFAKYDIEKQPPTIMLAQSIIKNILTDNQPTPITIEKIVNEVSRTFSVSINDIYSEKRKANIIKARKVTLYIVREITGLSYEMIGEEFGKHHSTIMYSVDQCQKDMDKDSNLAATVNDIIKNIREN